MSDRFNPISARALARWLSEEFKERGEMLGIPRKLFWDPRSSLLKTEIFGRVLETPLGTAAGPHTQLAGNIVASWLVGGRFIELKTIQTLDDLDVAKPCIDAEDATFNCEWSQELKLEQSLDEYVKAWVIIHVLNKRLWNTGTFEQPGFVFNMSVGYNLDGILKPNVQKFLEGMADAKDRIERYKEKIVEFFPEARDIEIPSVVSDNVTLSTMHGCPPEEIEGIAHYLLTKRKYHTTVKMNPTLLGPEILRNILHDQAGFSEIDVPDEAFEHDTKYDDAVGMISRLRDVAAKEGLTFGLKLTNTLEVRNHRSVFPKEQSMMYMSGRALHPLSVALAKQITDEFGHTIPISFAGGADAFNIVDILAGGLYPITVCTDLLKPGGYGRMHQYLETILETMKKWKIKRLQDIAPSYAWQFRDFQSKFKGLLEHEAKTRNLATSFLPPTEAFGSLSAIQDNKVVHTEVYEAFNGACRRICLESYLSELFERSWQSARSFPIDTKNSEPLRWFDCVKAPCQTECPAHQDIPQYMRMVKAGDFEGALQIIMKTNALPHTTGAVCDHPCTTKCIRNHYDAPLLIREIKRGAAAYGKKSETSPSPDIGANGKNKDNAGKAALIGAGPASLSAAYFLTQNGWSATLFDSRKRAGGMPDSVIPSFRLPHEDLELDLDAIRALGASFRFGEEAGRDFTISSLFENGFDAVFIGVGAQRGRRLGIEGDDAEGVMDGLSFLKTVKLGDPPTLGENIVVIGGGNSAMDCARTAWRAAEPHAKVTVLYRRTRAQMPADPEEIQAVLEEGVEIIELSNPVSVIKRGYRISALNCVKMELGEPDKSGRPRPVPIDGSSFEIPCTSLIVSVGQAPSLDFTSGSFEQSSGATEPQTLKTNRNNTICVDPETQETSVRGVFAGGDAVRGPSTIINGVADGRRAAEAIVSRFLIQESRATQTKTTPERIQVITATTEVELEGELKTENLMMSRTKRVLPNPSPTLPLSERHGFKEVTPVFSREQAVKEAERCLSCDLICNLCVTVCPNRANQVYETTPSEVSLPVYVYVNGALTIKGEKKVVIEQGTQIINITDLCNECGNCETFCPTGGAPYKDKPRLHLEERTFNDETVDALLIDSDGEDVRLRMKAADGEHVLIQESGHVLVYEGPKVSGRIKKVIDSKPNWEVEEVLPGAKLQQGESIDMEEAFKLDVLLTGLLLSIGHIINL